VSTPANTPDRADRWGLYLTVLLGVAGAVATCWVTVGRLLEILTGDGIPVLVPFVGETSTLPIGPGGAPVEVAVDQAVVTVADPAGATLFALVAQPIVTGLAILAGIALLCVFCLRVARGRTFERATVRLIGAGAIVLLVGWGLGSLFRTMGVNGTLAAVSDRSYDGVLFETDFTAFFAALALGAIGAAFQIGHRLQRETEGLV
jgi:hypothetical protein